MPGCLGVHVPIRRESCRSLVPLLVRRYSEIFCLNERQRGNVLANDEAIKSSKLLMSQYNTIEEPRNSLHYRRCSVFSSDEISS